MIAGRYELVEEIGRGGMATVWRGRDAVLEREVALKKVSALDDVAVERATREAQLAARLNDPHVVAVYDLVTEDAQSWLVMEHVDGTSLAERIADLGALDRREVATLGLQIAEALAAAHAADIVHRDVKPSNVLIPIDGPAKLSDFGIARGEGDDVLTRTGLVTGSPAYLAPEVAAGQRAASASDVWSLGATLLHAATGHAPFDGADHVMGTLYRIVNDPPPRLDGDDALARTVATMLQHDVDARPTAAEVAAQLAGFTDDAHATQALPLVTETQTLESRPTTTASAAPAASVIPAAREALSRRPWLIVGAAAVAVLALLLIWTTQGDDPPAEAAATPPATSAPATEPEPEPTPTDDPATFAELEDFARSYVALAADDPKRSFDLLTPAYQQASGGLKGYRDFWDGVEDPVVRDVAVDPEALQVRYTYDYTYDGKKGPGKGKGDDDDDDEREQRTETVALQLVRDGDGFLIAGSP